MSSALVARSSTGHACSPVSDRTGGLYAHVVLFGFIYPAERHQVPTWVMEELAGRLAAETRSGDDQGEKVCYGTIVSRQQYLKDLNDWGYADARLADDLMSPEDIRLWTAGIAIDGAKG
jgi:hypothetical protein